VGRTLLSAAFDFAFDFDPLVSLPVKSKIKNGGQECPPHAKRRRSVSLTQLFGYTLE
jgi:hypothetical protein